LFVCLFIATQASFSAIWRLSTLLMTGLQVQTYAKHVQLLAVRVLLRATPTATQDLHFKGQIRKTHDSYF
jgi:hypothetical protein